MRTHEQHLEGVKQYYRVEPGDTKMAERFQAMFEFWTSNRCGYISERIVREKLEEELEKQFTGFTDEEFYRYVDEVVACEIELQQLLLEKEGQ